MEVVAGTVNRAVLGSATMNDAIDPTPATTIAAIEERYANLPPGGINEANTRLQFINDMLTGVLGWPIEQMIEAGSGEIVWRRRRARS